jgi:hypothetical protein
MVARFSVCLVVAAICFSGPSAQAQNYLYVPEEGGVVDLDTGLVWVDVTSAIGSATYDYAVANMLGHYTDWEAENGHTPHNDWRLPIVEEILDGHLRGLYDAMVDAGVGPYQARHWAGDPKFKEKGKWYAWQASVYSGVVSKEPVKGAAYIMLVRQIAQ